MPAPLPKYPVGKVVHGFEILSISDDGKRCLKQTTYRVKATACGCVFWVGHYGLQNRLPRIPDGICKPCLMLLSLNGIFGKGYGGARQDVLDRMDANGADTSAWPRHPVEKASTPAPAPSTGQPGRLIRQWGLT